VGCVTGYLKLLRAGTLFSPAADVTAGLCLAGLAWSPAAALAAVASVCVYAAGMVLNDHADRALDAEQRPERPIPRGDVPAFHALLLGAALLSTGVLVSSAAPYYAVMAALVLGYNYLLKASPLVGALTMGTLRAMNLCAGVVAVTGATPSRAVLIAAGVYACYIIAVTLLGILEDQRNAPRRVVVSVQLVPGVCGPLAMLGMPSPWPATIIACGLSAAFLWRMRGVRSWDQAAIRGSMTWLLLGTMLYTGLLCLAAARPMEAAVIGAAVLPARWISRRIAMT